MTTKEEENKRMMHEVYRKREVLKKSPITIEQYRDYKGEGLADTKIMEKVGMHNAAFNEWKRAAGLIQKTEKPKKKESPVEKSAEKSETLNTDQSEIEELKSSHNQDKVQETYIPEDTTLEIKTLREELDATESKYKKVLDERDDLRSRVSELEETESLELKQAQAYQQQGEQSYRLLLSEYDELQRQVDSLRDAEELSVALARRCVLLSKAVEV